MMEILTETEKKMIRIIISKLRNKKVEVGAEIEKKMKKRNPINFLKANQQLFQNWIKINWKN